ncbi:MAG: hypothetical protein GY814_06590 [Gammaproteobacteria bacterium]|nr:hypothetical protein [Gammaproteobacteria bacterium]
MITEFKPGTLYRLSPKHHLYWGALQSASRIFLCTEKMYPPTAGADGVVYRQGNRKIHLLIDVESGGLWASDPKKHNYEEYLQ